MVLPLHSIRALTYIALLGNRMLEQILCKFNYEMVNDKSAHVVSFLPNTYFQNKTYFWLICLGCLFSTMIHVWLNLQHYLAHINLVNGHKSHLSITKTWICDTS